MYALEMEQTTDIITTGRVISSSSSSSEIEEVEENESNQNEQESKENGNPT